MQNGRTERSKKTANGNAVAPASVPEAWVGGADRRSGGRDLVQKLLEQRQEMLVMYCHLAGLEPYKKNGKKDRELLQRFCETLVDYLAAGHFSLYERIANGNERRESVSKRAAEVYPDIATTTQGALDFNDKYDAEEYLEISFSFPEDLSKLGEHIARRVELEDQLLVLMH